MELIDNFFAFMNSILNPYSSIPESTFLILGIALLLAVVSTTANRLLVDVKRMREITEEVKAWRREMDIAKKSDDKKNLAKTKKKQEAMMKLQGKMMWDRMKVSFLFIAPFYLIFIVLSRFYIEPVAISPFTLPIIMSVRELAYISWYIICSFALSLPLSRLLGVNPED